MNSRRSIETLAVFGGPPAFSETLHVGRPNIGNRARLLQRIEEVLDRRWLTNRGPLVQEFERAVATYLGVRHCVAMCNGSLALEIAARAAGLTGEVIVPSFTFVATAHILQWQGLTPVFCDIDPATHTIDPGQVERLITPRTTGILGVHLWGRPCQIEALDRLARKYRLRLLFDASHAFGCSYQGRMIGTFGHAEVFSFHATKFVNAFEGGAVVTNDAALAEQMRLMQNFGFAGLDHVVSLGTNAKMNEVSAAMGLTSLESTDAFIAVNEQHYRTYARHLAGLPGLRLRPYDRAERCNYQYVVLEIDEARAGIGRDGLLEILHAENVRARRYFWPGCHRMEPYRSLYPEAGRRLPETERLSERVLCLPTGTAVGTDDILTICQIVCLVVQHAAEVTRRLNDLKMQPA